MFKTTWCLIRTAETEQLAEKFKMKEDVVRKKITNWQRIKMKEHSSEDDVNKWMETYPTDEEFTKYLEESKPKIKLYEGNWTREKVAEEKDCVFLFGDNTADRTQTHYVPTKTQAVIRDLPNAIGIDTKKDRGTNKSSYFSDDDFDTFKAQVDEALTRAIKSGKVIVIPKGGIGTGASYLGSKAFKCYTYLQNCLKALKMSNGKTFDINEVSEFDSSMDIDLAVEEILNPVLCVPNASSIIARNETDLNFTSQTRRDRVTYITRAFTAELDYAVDEAIEELDNLIKTLEQDSEDHTLRLEKLKQEQKYAKTNPEAYRMQILKTLGPGEIFRRVLQYSFVDYVKDSYDNRLAAELVKINANDETSGLSDEEKLEKARSIVDYKTAEYQKVIDNFIPLVEEATIGLVSTEGIVVDASDAISDEIFDDQDNDEGNDHFGEMETQFKDGWMSNFREVSSFRSLSRQIRKMLSSIRKFDGQGKIETDDLGNDRFLDPQYAHAVLIDKMRNIENSRDVLPMLTELSKNYKWILPIIDELQSDSQLFSKFYQDMDKAFVSYWIQTKKMGANGVERWETKSLNRPEGVYYLLDAWRDNMEAGTQLTKNSVYDKSGHINKDNVKVGKDLLEELRKRIDNDESLDIEGSFEDRKTLMADKDFRKKLLKVMNMIGISVDPAILRDAMIEESRGENAGQTHIRQLLARLAIIYDGIKADKNLKKSEDAEGNVVVENVDLINTFGSAYNYIALMLARVSEDAIESNLREAGKTYYAHVNPNYMSKMMKKLKNVSKDPQRFKDFLEDEFKQYDWFYDKEKGEWKHDWLRQLEESEEMRNGFDHKVLLNVNKVEYKNWDDLDGTVALLTEYWGDPERDEGTQWAWYHVPILSNAPTAEFLRFRRYTSTQEKDENDNYRRFQDIILDKLEVLFYQELGRINLVNKRDALLSKGGSKIEHLERFDIVRDKNGKIKNKGGSEFKFLSFLNTKTVEVNGQQVPFLERFLDLQKNGNAVELRKFLRDTIEECFEEDFENVYAEWNNIGLFQESADGMYMHLNFDARSKKYYKLSTTLSTIKSLIGEQSANYTDVSRLIDYYSKGYMEHERHINDKEVNEIFTRVRKELAQMLAAGKITKADYENFIYQLNTDDAAKDALREYYWNSKFASSQIIEIFATDLAYYNGIEDFQKRFKEVHSPALRVDTLAMYNGERIGRDEEHTIYLKDFMISSRVADDIAKIILARNQETVTVIDEVTKKEKQVKKLSDFDAANILAKFGWSNYTDDQGRKYVEVGKVKVKTDKVDVANAQAYRSLKSYRAILGMSGEWDDVQEKAFQRFQNGEWTSEDFNVIWQTKKPFLYTQTRVNSGIDNIAMRVGVQHKNSEFLLLAAQLIMSNNPMGSSNPLVALNRVMEGMDENGKDVKGPEIDVIQFESAVKVGKQGVINTDEFFNEDGSTKSAKEIYRIIKQRAFNEDNSFNEEVVHTVSYEDYGIQVATPEHCIDAVQLVGTQIRKLITADMSDDTVIEIRGKKLTKKQWLDTYNKINTENILEDFIEVYDMFKDPKEISAFLQEEVKKSSRANIDLLRAVTLNEQGNFNIPLYDPVISNEVQTLLNSLIKNRITKQKIKGGALIQVSNFGLVDDLKIVFKSKNGHELSMDYFKKMKEDKWREKRKTDKSAKRPKITQEEFEAWKKEEEKSGTSIAYLECYMPAYSKDFYKALMNPQTGELDVTRLPEELRRLIGYRVPTEDKYSMAPLRIKGFLPVENGSAIMLPSEITTISGSDFDIDKMFVMLPEFRINYNMDAVHRKFLALGTEINRVVQEKQDIETQNVETHEHTYSNAFSESKDNTIKDLFDEVPAWYKQMTPKMQRDFAEWFEQNKESFLNPDIPIKYIAYNFDKEAKDQSRATRNNGLISMIFGALTSQDVASKLLNPGSFDYLKQAGKIENILDNVSYQELHEILKKEWASRGQDIDKPRQRYNGRPAPLSYWLRYLDLDTLIDIADKTKKKLDPLSPRTYMIFHQRNMAGLQMTARYANHNASHAIMQHTNLGLSKDAAFWLNGKKRRSLHDVANGDMEIISKLMANWLAAAVDTAKDNVIGDLNQSPFTADFTMLLTRLGFNPIEIGALLKQPIVSEICRSFAREQREGKSKKDIIDGVIKKYKAKIPVDSRVSERVGKFDDQRFMIDDLMMDTLLAKDVQHMNSIEQENFYQRQVYIGMLFNKIMKSADVLGRMVQATRSDTQNAAAGPTIADTMVKINTVEDFIAEAQHSNCPLVGAAVINPTLDIDLPKDKLRERLLESRVPFLQAFYTLGVQATAKMMGRYFPQYTVPFKRVISEMKGYMKENMKFDVKTINSIYNDLFAYIMNRLPFFNSDLLGSEFGSDGIRYKKSQIRTKFINEFPEYFNRALTAMPELKEIEFIKRLKEKLGKYNNGVGTVVFKNVGNLTPILRERYMRDWSSMCYSDNPAVRLFALNLFKYCYFRNGFGFNSSTFNHLAPLVLRELIPGYMKELRNMTELNYEDDFHDFVEQYIYNHLDNTRLVQSIPRSLAPKLILNKGEVKDNFVVKISKDSSYEIKKFIKKSDEGPNRETIYTFMDFVSIPHQGKTYYYKLNFSSDTDAEYVRIEPLGMKNQFIEYEYGVPVEEMETVIASNKIKSGIQDITQADRRSSDVQQAEQAEEAPAVPETVTEPTQTQQDIGAMLQQSMDDLWAGISLNGEETAQLLDLSTETPNFVKDAEDNEACDKQSITNAKI